MRVDCEWCGYGIQCRCRPGHRSTFADFEHEEENSMSFRVTLPVLGEREIRPAPNEPGHYLWLDRLGWHDCTPEEDAFITSPDEVKKRP